jgi:TolB-like protein
VARAPTKQRRKLAAILMADVVGYSRLTRLDEPGTLAEVRLRVNEQMRPQIRRHRGKLVKTLGDGVLAEFSSPVDAVQCALALQEASSARNRTQQKEKQLELRIGINLGDVVLEDGDILGDGVNIAARLQTLADPGGIVISHALAQHVKGKLSATLEDLGEKKLKNIPDPVRVYKVLLPGAVAGRPARQEKASATPSIAVLPFLNMSGDPEQSYFSDGITEDIITELARFRTFQVIARNSSFVYRDKAVDVKQIADELGVEFVVEGSVRKLDERVRITVQVINAETRRHVWADKYDVDLSGIFAVQDDVTRRVVATLVPKIEAEELENARKRPTAHVRAYECYLRGKALYFSGLDAKGRAGAQKFFEEAIALDPQFAAPYCYLARIENNFTMFSAAGVPLEPFRLRAWQYAQKAVALDDSDPHAHFCLAWCHLWRHEFEAARKHLDISMRLNPNDAERAVDRGTTLMYLGEVEAGIESMNLGIRLNPYHPDAFLGDLAEAYFVARRYDDMLKLAEQIRDPSPRFPAWKAAAYAYAGRQEEARHAAEDFVARVRAIWAGDASAGTPQYVAWLLSFSPFRSQADRRHLVEGLKRAGLDTGNI